MISEAPADHSALLHGLATALPPFELPQDVVAEQAKELLGPKYPQFHRLMKTFKTAGIEHRYSVAPIEWFKADHGWEDRNREYLAGAEKLFVSAAQRALENAGWQANEVDTIVTVSSTGIATPTLEARTLTEIGFRENVLRVPVFGLGCAGGVSGLTIAADLAKARPESKVLLVVVETCTLSFRSDRLQTADIIATVLFGDGAAAACLSTANPASGTRIAIGSGYQKTWPDTLAIMGWDVDEAGFGVIFDRSIPAFVSERFAAAASEALSATGVRKADISRFVCHPGGAKVVEAIEASLGLPAETLDAERETLREAGNMSAPTVLFVLQKVLNQGRTGRMMACALGPGFTASFLPFTVEEAV